MKAMLCLLALIAALGGVYAMGRAHEHAVMQRKLDASAAQLKTCKANAAGLVGVIDVQTTATRTAAADSARRLAEATAAVERAQTHRTADATTATKVMQPLAASDSCARLMEVDRRLLESLR